MSTNKKMATQVTISEAQAGQRIDNFLMKHLKGVPRSHVYRLLRSGQVRVNSGRKKPHYKLSCGDIMRIPPVRANESADDTVPESVSRRLATAILYEDEDIIALNKPSGIAVHKGSGLRFGVIEAMRQIRPAETLELVHRLDRETSGCLLLAKNRKTLTLLHTLLRHERTVHIEKTYIALLDGAWQSGEQTIDVGLSKVKRGGEHLIQPDPQGDRAISHFKPIEILTLGDGSRCSLMEIRIDTGRTHQIRVHAQYCGLPILGDTRYGDKDSNHRLREAGLKRLFLHAKSLYLPLDTPVMLEAPLSDDLENLLRVLHRQEDA